MKYILIVLLMVSGATTYCQHDIKPTEQFTIEGLVNAPFTFQLKDASKYMSVRIDSVVIKNHLKERKGVVKNLRGILLKETFNIQQSTINVQFSSNDHFSIT